MSSHRLSRVGGALIAIVFGALLTSSIAVIVSGMRDDIHQADVAVVLGNEVNADGTPSRRLAARLDTAAALYRRGLFADVIVSGATGRAGFNEATVMKNYPVRVR